MQLALNQAATSQGSYAAAQQRRSSVNSGAKPNQPASTRNLTDEARKAYKKRIRKHDDDYDNEDDDDEEEDAMIDEDEDEEMMMVGADDDEDDDE
jgi:hypothetical protein